MKLLRELCSHKLFSIVAVFTVSFLFFAVLQSTPTLLDPDSYYHLKVSQLIMEKGLIGQQFPWLAFTTLANNYADQHFLYHLALIPFLKLLSPLFAGKLATIFFGSLVMTAMFAMMKSWKVKSAWFFILLALTNYHFVFRLNLIKASGLAILILLLGVWVMISDTGLHRLKIPGKFNPRKSVRYFLLVLISILYVLVHGGSIIILAAAGIWVVANAIEKIEGHSIVPLHMRSRMAIVRNFFSCLFYKENILTVVVVVGGLAVGYILHPDRQVLFNFLGQQLVQIGFFTKVATLRVGSEWYPFPVKDFFIYNWVVVLFYILGALAFFVRKESRSAKSIFLFVFSFIFLLFTIRSKRFIEYFIPLAILFSAVTLPDLLATVKNIWRQFKQPVYLWATGVVFGALLICTLTVGAGYNVYQLIRTFRGGHQFTVNSGGAKWIKEHAQANEIVFNSDWDVFPSLFYYNDYNRYIVGLDPTFMYEFNPTISKLYDSIILGKEQGDLKDEFLNTFHAKYIYVAKKSDTLRNALLKSGEFIILYADGDGEVWTAK